MTAQVPEALILDGRRCDMTTCPLKEDHPRVRPRRPDEEEAPAPRDPLDLAMEEDPARYIGSTACWRGYVGTWEIRDKRLYLVKLQGRFVLDGDEPLFADWVHQTLAVPQGRLVQYVHMGFQSRYESELWIDISGGVETKRETIEGGLQALIDRLLASKPVIADLAIIAGPQTGDLLPLRSGFNELRLAHGGRLSIETGDPTARLIVYQSGETIVGLSDVVGPVIRVNGEPLTGPTSMCADKVIEIGEHRCQVRMKSRD